MNSHIREHKIQKQQEHRSMTQKQAWSILERLQLNPVYYLNATKAQTQCLFIISLSAKKKDPSASQSCLFAGTESSFSLRGLTTQNIWRKPNGQATKLENVQACSPFQLMYIMVSLCRSHNNRRHQHKCLCHYVSDGLIDSHCGRAAFNWLWKSYKSQSPSHGVLTLYAIVLYCVQEQLLLPATSLALSLHGWIDTHFHMTRLWHGVRRCSGTGTKEPSSTAALPKRIMRRVQRGGFRYWRWQKSYFLFEKSQMWTREPFTANAIRLKLMLLFRLTQRLC